MTLSIRDPSSLWNRTLPKPSAILQTLPNSLPSRRDSSLLQHHLVSHTLSHETLDSNGARRNTVPCISYHEREPSKIGTINSSHDDNLISSNTVDPSMRKRDASQMDEDHNSRPTTPSSPGITEGAREFCLCQPDPKIPRPRNAFILFRQHQQAAVVAQHPGLPNPEISKIIGEQWRSLPHESKSEWKALAEEEKARHSQQYPDYRYQPRRNGRYSNTSSVSGASGGQTVTVSEQGTCLKCFGKVMNPPNTPYNPFQPASIAPPPLGLVSMHPPRRPYPVNSAPANIRPQMNVPIASPRSARVRPYTDVFGRQQPQHDPRLRYTSQPPPPTPSSPEPNKRRRFNGHGVLIPDPGEFYPQQGQHYSAFERPMMRTEMMQAPRAAMAPPQRSDYHPAPPRPHVQQVRPQYPPPQRDPSLVLPPLKTVTGEPSPTQTQKSGIEAMIKSIPALNKLKFLTQISPPLANPSVASPPFEIRGAILAVEGLDAAAVWNMTHSLAEQLERDGKFLVRIFGGPDPYENIRKSIDTSKEKLMSMQTFLSIIGEWHRVSKEMTEYITTAPGQIHFNTTNLERRVEDQDRQMTEARLLLPPDSAVSPKTMNKAAELSLTSPLTKLPTSATATQVGEASSVANGQAERTPRRTPQTPPTTSSPQQSLVPSPAHSATIPNAALTSVSHSRQNSTQSSPTLIPICLIPHYQLTTVDASAIALPITDAYSPLSHWQWLATLWRGCVGPDVSVVVEDINESSNARSSVPRQTEPTAVEGVEVRLQDARAIVVRLALDAPALESEGWEKAKRRVGFEVEEFFRR